MMYDINRYFGFGSMGAISKLEITRDFRSSVHPIQSHVTVKNTQSNYCLKNLLIQASPLERFLLLPDLKRPAAPPLLPDILVPVFPVWLRTFRLLSAMGATSVTGILTGAGFGGDGDGWLGQQ